MRHQLALRGGGEEVAEGAEPLGGHHPRLHVLQPREHGLTAAADHDPLKWDAGNGALARPWELAEDDVQLKGAIGGQDAHATLAPPPSRTYQIAEERRK